MGRGSEKDNITRIHGNIGRKPSNFFINDKLISKIILLKKSPAYNETNFRQFQKKLSLNEGIEISYTALAILLKKAGIASPNGNRRSGKSFRWRKRRKHFGDMLQIGATRYDWFNNGSPCVLHWIIDDATGRLTGLCFCQNECLAGFLVVLKQTVTDYGIPMEIFTAIDGLFFEKPANASRYNSGDTLVLTGFGALVDKKLGIELSGDETATGKNCHDVLNAIMYEHLPAWLKSRGITCIEHANCEIRHYTGFYNSVFKVRPKSLKSKFVFWKNGIELEKYLDI